MSHIFISYASDDARLARRVAKELAKARRKGWLDVNDIRVGGPWRDEIDKALRSAQAVVVILSGRSTQNQYVTYEWSFALGAGVRIIPILAGGASLQTVHKRLQGLQCLDLGKEVKPWGRLLRELSAKRTDNGQMTKNSLSPSLPTIRAEFELEDGKPVRVKKSYRIWISTRDVPNGTKRVRYKILDKSFDNRKFSVRWGKRDFADWITSYGDIYLTARGKARGRSWRTQATLAEALRRTYGSRPKGRFEKAITEIENN